MAILELEVDHQPQQPLQEAHMLFNIRTTLQATTQYFWFDKQIQAQRRVKLCEEMFVPWYQGRSVRRCSKWCHVAHRYQNGHMFQGCRCPYHSSAGIQQFPATFIPSSCRPISSSLALRSPLSTSLSPSFCGSSVRKTDATVKCAQAAPSFRLPRVTIQTLRPARGHSSSKAEKSRIVSISFASNKIR